MPSGLQPTASTAIDTSAQTQMASSATGRLGDMAVTQPTLKSFAADVKTAMWCAWTDVKVSVSAQYEVFKETRQDKAEAKALAKAQSDLNKGASGFVDSLNKGAPKLAEFEKMFTAARKLGDDPIAQCKAKIETAISLLPPDQQAGVRSALAAMTEGGSTFETMMGDLMQKAGRHDRLATVLDKCGIPNAVRFSDTGIARMLTAMHDIGFAVENLSDAKCDARERELKSFGTHILEGGGMTPALAAFSAWAHGPTDSGENIDFLFAVRDFKAKFDGLKTEEQRREAVQSIFDDFIDLPSESTKTVVQKSDGSFKVPANIPSGARATLLELLDPETETLRPGADLSADMFDDGANSIRKLVDNEMGTNFVRFDGKGYVETGRWDA